MKPEDCGGSEDECFDDIFSTILLKSYIVFETDSVFLIEGASRFAENFIVHTFTATFSRMRLTPHMLHWCLCSSMSVKDPNSRISCGLQFSVINSINNMTFFIEIF